MRSATRSATFGGLVLVVVVALTGAWAPAPAAVAAAALTTLASVASDGTQGDGPSFNSSVSADGRFVAFDSEADNLVAGDTNARGDVFVHDRQTGTTTRVSVASDGTQANEGSGLPAISADGRVVAFVSAATNLVAGDTNALVDVFVHDRLTGQTTRVNVASDGTQAGGVSPAVGGADPSISADGRFVAFHSDASNLVPGDTNTCASLPNIPPGECPDVFVHDLQTGQTTRVSVASDGTQGDDQSFRAAISADGRFVAFVSSASNLVAGDSNGEVDVFVHDRQTGQTTRASVASDGTQANGASSGPAISADGRLVAFSSEASNLVPHDTNGRRSPGRGEDVFVHDRQTGQTTRASVASGPGLQQGNGPSLAPSISADGRFVAFSSGATNLVPHDSNRIDDVFVHDRQTGATVRASVASDGTQATGIAGLFDFSTDPSISADGHLVAFTSSATNLVPEDVNRVTDVFVRLLAP
jgi:Tol biopolymer transport system component